MSLLSNIYIITIKRNLERQQRMASLLKQHKLKFSFIDGIDGDHLMPEHLDKVFDGPKSNEKLGYVLTKNEIACSLSHIKAMKIFLENDKQEYALILEDDIETSNFETLQDAIKWLPLKEAWDLLYLGYQDMNTRMPISIFIKWQFIYPVLNFFKIKRYDLKKIRRIFGRPYNNFWFHAGFHNNAHAYIVSRSAAKKIIDYNTPITLQADRVLMDMITEGKLNAYALNQPVFQQFRDLVSSIGERESWN
jgi:GR25 family glycosyltransferase involved in LPS biosynthesis